MVTLRPTRTSLLRQPFACVRRTLYILISVPSLTQVRRILKLRWLPIALLLCSLHALAQTAEAPPSTGRVVLVLPFDNRTGQTNLAWIGDSFPDTLNQRLTSAGFLTITSDDLQFALDHLGLPADFRPTRATTIRIAQTLDANYVVVGNYTLNKNRIAVQAQVLDINQLHMSQPLADSSELNRLFDVENAIAWKIARQIEPHFNVAEQTFLSASEGVSLSAFENYIRGIGASNLDDKIKRLQAAIQIAPNYPAALLALGKAQFADRDYDHAAATLAKVPRSDRRALEAGFYLGLARFNSAKYADAEAAFAFVASRLPLPEVVNNQGVASSRQGHNAIPLFQRAVAADPNDPDYHYNLAVSFLRQGDFAAAQREVDQTLKLKPSDSEAAQLKSSIAAGRKPSTPAAKADASTTDAPAFDPLERIRRTYSEASFRQAAFQLDQMRALRMATLPKAEQATQYSQLGRDYLAQGLIPEAEQEFQAALAADASSAEAHAGLAHVRERSGNPTDARAEAQSSLKLRPNADAYLVLARIELQANQLSASASDVGNALKLEPKNSAALGMKQALQARGQSLP
jgi:tetratricopeptide (TPR) repeat protein